MPKGIYKRKNKSNATGKQLKYWESLIGRKLPESVKSKMRGKTVWNKGTKGLCKANNKSFKKGQIPWNKDKVNVMPSGKNHHGWGEKYSKDKIEKLSIAHKGQHSSPKTEFKKGLIPWNKDMQMSDDFRNKARQRRLKQIIPFKDTSIEIKLQNWLKEQGIEFKTHYPILGQPDIFIEPNICIFADGCYWHKCPQCGYGEGRERDLMVTEGLLKQGYIVYRLWEHEINKNITKELIKFLS